MLSAMLSLLNDHINGVSVTSHRRMGSSSPTWMGSWLNSSTDGHEKVRAPTRPACVSCLSAGMAVLNFQALDVLGWLRNEIAKTRGSHGKTCLKVGLTVGVGACAKVLSMATAKVVYLISFLVTGWRIKNARGGREGKGGCIGFQTSLKTALTCAKIVHAVANVFLKT